MPQRDYVLIRFDEPIVTESQQAAGKRPELSDADRGVDGIIISGDEQHKPALRWIDQDSLMLRFPKEADRDTEYVLTFAPGKTYLSGRAISEQPLHFRLPRIELEFRALSGYPEPIFLVMPEVYTNAQSLDLKPEDVVAPPLTDEQTNEKIALRASPALVKHGVFTEERLRMMEKAGVNFAELTPESPAPGAVVLTPEKPLTPGHTYLLPTSKDVLTVEKLSSELNLCLKPAAKLNLSFNHPIRTEQRDALFAGLQLHCGQESAVTQPDGSKTLGKLRFSLVPNGEDTPHVPRVCNDFPQEEGIRYQEPDSFSTLQIRVEGEPPTEPIDLTVPAGITCTRGLQSTESQTHRITISPALPQLQSNSKLWLCGSHQAVLRCLALGAVTARAYRFSPELWAEEADFVRRQTAVDEQSLREDVADARAEAGLGSAGEIRDWQRTAKRRAEDRAEREAQQKRLESILRRAEAGPAVPLPAPDTAGGLADSGELRVDMDALTGGKLRAGYYVLRFEAPDAVRYTVLHVTDMQVMQLSDRQLLAYSVSKGEPLAHAEMRLFGKKGAIENASLDKGIGDCGDSARALVIDGDDYELLELPYASGTPHDKLRIVMNSDRSLYRPGDEVHYVGIVRQMRDQVPTLPREGEPVHLTVRRPDRSVLLQHETKLDKHGVFDFAFTLPTGEEDVTGLYHVQVSCGGTKATADVESAVFRRDSMSAACTIKLAPIAPKEGTIELSVRDFNGAAPVGGKAEVDIAVTSQNILHTSAGEATHEEHRSVWLDREGKALIPFEIPLTEPYNNADADVRIDLSNDREEHLRTGAQKEFHAADFHSEFRSDQDAVRLSLIPSDKGVAPREQTVHVCFSKQETEVTDFGNGFRRCTPRMRVVTEQDVTATIGSKEGVRIPLSDTEGEFTYTCTGRDTEGREMKEIGGFWFPHNRYHTEDPLTVDLDYEGESKAVRPGEHRDVATLPRSVKATISSKTACRALLVWLDSKGVTVDTVQLEAQEQVFTHEAREEGSLQLAVIPLMHGQEGPDTLSERDIETESVLIPRLEHRMGLTTAWAQNTVRPGGEQTLTGKVCNPDGSPAEGAQLIIWAVDRGMLHVGDLYDPFHSLDALCEEFLPGFRFHLRDTDEWATLALKPRPTLWMGQDIADPHLMYGLRALYRGGAIPLMTKANAVAAPAAPMADTDFVEEKTGETSGGVGGMGSGRDFGDTVVLPRMRSDFTPLATWATGVMTEADGSYRHSFRVPDTLTTYDVFITVVSANGHDFGEAKSAFTVNQPLMMTPGTPLFMSTGDCLSLPLSLTNNSDAAGTWTVRLESQEQQVQLAAGESKTLYFTVQAAEEGERTLQWSAVGEREGDAVEGCFPVRFPAPLLKEEHHVVLQAGEELRPAERIAPELRDSHRVSVRLACSANPLIHLADAADFTLNYPYDCTEQHASALLPLLMHKRLAPFCPSMGELTDDEIRLRITESITGLARRQQADGGLSYWCRGGSSCFWASAYAGMVLTMAQEQGYTLPDGLLPKLRNYLGERADKENPKPTGAVLYALGRCLDNRELMLKALDEPQETQGGLAVEPELLRTLLTAPDARHAAFLRFMRSAGHDYRHRTTWQSGWTLIALYEYLRSVPPESAPAELLLPDGSKSALNNGTTAFDFTATPQGCYKAESGTVYATLSVKAQPEQTEYPGVTEKGLQITRVYEKRGEDGIWRPTTEFAVGDVVRISLTCAKVSDELRYFVLEDYLPSSMEAINPNVPAQAAGLEWQPWSSCFDYREFLADRVRGFCTRWAGRHLLNMSYYARVKRAGSATAPPAQAQLMYEPQCYGLSPNTRFETERVGDDAFEESEDFPDEFESDESDEPETDEEGDSDFVD